MNNISELIGIIKGINFDGIVNDLEKKHLQSWVDANRELVYDKNDVEMINLIDSILSEHIITETKRRQLLSCSERYLEEMTDSRRYIDELHGIIIGIICDGKVNAEEVTQLRLWLTKNRQFICENEINEEILYRIEDILSEGQITEEKQNQLLELLSSNINGLQAKTKLNDIRQLVRERKNIGLALINILDDENMIDLIHRQAECQLNEALRSYSCYMNDPEIVFISLCLIGMLDYDGNFYEHVHKTYDELYRYYSEQKIDGTIRTILCRYYTEESRKGNSRIISIALSNAIVPAYYLGAFFEFIFDIYKLNFEFDIPTNLEEEFEFVYDGLRNSMLSHGDDVHINVTRKSYKLIETTKQLITDGKHLDSVIELSIIVVRLIDKHIWSGAVQVGNPYIKAGYETWLKKHHNDLKTKPNRKGTELRSRWEPKLQLCQNHIQLLPPIHRIKMQYNYRNIQILIKNGDKVIYRDDTPDIREIIGGYQISVNAVELKEPLGKITYFLMSDQKIIYSSKKKLYRDYIVFDGNGHELQNNNDYKGIAIFCTAPDVFHGAVYCQSDSYVLSTQKVKYGDVATIGTDIFSFSSLTKPGIFGDKIPNQYLLREETTDLIPVFSKVKFLVFESTNDTENFEFSINNRLFRLSDFHYTRTVRQNSWKFVVDIIINQPGVYEITVFEKFAQKRSRIASFHFGYDSHFEINESKIDNDNYRVCICSDLDVSPIEKEFSVNTFTDDWLKIHNNGFTYTYYVPLNTIFYRIHGQMWRPVSENLWIDDIAQDTVIEFYGADVEGLMVYSDSGTLLHDDILTKYRGIYTEVAVGFLRSYKELNDYVQLMLIKDGRAIGLLLCYNRCVFNKESTEIIFDSTSKILTVLPVYTGKGNVYFEVTDKCGIEYYATKLLKSGVPICVERPQSFVDYQLRFYEKAKGLLSKKERELMNVNEKFYAKEDFAGRYFKIDEVQYDQYVRGKLSRKTHYFNHVFVYFREQVCDDVFRGDIVIKTTGGSFELYNINPVAIEMCGDVIDGKLDLAITKEGDGLLLDFKHHGIMNTLTDDKAVDIFSYTIDANGKETL